MDIIKEKWEEILYTVKLEHELTDVSFDTWLKHERIFQCLEHVRSPLLFRPAPQFSLLHSHCKRLLLRSASL